MRARSDSSIRTLIRRPHFRGSWVLALCAAATLAGALARGEAKKSATTAPATTAPAATQPATTQPGARITKEGWFAPTVRQSELPALPAEVTNAFVIPIREPIGKKTYEAVRRKLLHCQMLGAQLIILDMDTWGGGLFAGLDIARMLKTEVREIRVVCYVRTRAISAGSMIALACDEIVVTPVGMLGDCGVVLTMPSGTTVVMPPDKQETVVRAEMRESAKMHGYSEALAQAMVSDDLEAWLIRNKRTRQLQYVLADEFRGRVTIPQGLVDANSNPKAQWELLRVIVPEGKLLTADSSQAIEYGFASATVDSPPKEPLAKLAEHYNVTGEFTVLEDSWSEELVDFLTSGTLTTVLVFGMMLFGYIEMHTPGFGLFGAIALVCLALLVGSRYLTGLALWWEIALFVVGVVLLTIEVFITPGFGVLGTLGGIFCFTAIVLWLAPNVSGKWLPSGELAWAVFRTGVAAMGIGVIASVVAMMLVARFLPKLPMANWLILKSPAAAASNPALEGVQAIRLGQTAVVIAICRPAGQVRIGDKLVDAVTEGEYIPAGEKVKVIRNETNRVVVTRA